jgi:hypothetical protein
MSEGCVAALRAFHSVFVSHFVPDSLTATVGNLALVATPLAVIVAPLLLRGYAIQIRQLMRLRQVAEPPESWLARLRHGASSTSPPSDPPSAPVTAAVLQEAAAARLAAIRRATWAAYATFVIPAPALLLTAPSTPLADIIGFCAAVPMLAAVPALVNVRRMRCLCRWSSAASISSPRIASCGASWC